MPSGKSYCLITSLNHSIHFLTEELGDTFLLLQSYLKTNKKCESPWTFQSSSGYFFRQFYFLKPSVH